MNDNHYAEVNKKTVSTFVESYKTMEPKQIRKTIRNTEQIDQLTFDDNMKPRIPPRRKQGRPKYKWAERASIEYWNETKQIFHI